MTRTPQRRTQRPVELVLDLLDEIEDEREEQLLEDIETGLLDFLLRAKKKVQDPE